MFFFCFCFIFIFIFIFIFVSVFVFVFVFVAENFDFVAENNGVVIGVDYPNVLFIHAFKRSAAETYSIIRFALRPGMESCYSSSTFIVKLVSF